MFVPPAASVPPWQYVLAHEAPFQTGAAPPLVASGPQRRSTWPFTCERSVGST